MALGEKDAKEFIKNETISQVNTRLLKIAAMFGVANIAALGAIYWYTSNQVSSYTNSAEVKIDKFLENTENDIPILIANKVNDEFKSNSKLIGDIEKRISSLSETEGNVRLNIGKLEQRSSSLDSQLQSVEASAQIINAVGYENILTTLETITENTDLSRLISNLQSLETSSLQESIWIEPEMKTGWRVLSKDWRKAAYTKDDDGIVHLRGMVRHDKLAKHKDKANLPIPDIFLLPEGFRPDQHESFASLAWDIPVRIDVTPAGKVAVRGNMPGRNKAFYGWVSLSGISFKAGS